MKTCFIRAALTTSVIFILLIPSLPKAATQSYPNNAQVVKDPPTFPKMEIIAQLEINMAEAVYSTRPIVSYAPITSVIGGNELKSSLPKPIENSNSPVKSTCSGEDPSSTNPVKLSTGEKFKVESDIPFGGPASLGLTRTYKSLSSNAWLFGTKWLSDYDYAPIGASGCYRSSDYPNKCIPTQAILGFPDGSTYTYTMPTPYNGLLVYSVKGSAAMGQLTYTPGNGDQT